MILSMDSQQQNIIICNTSDGKTSVALYAKDGDVWMNQNQLAKLFDTSKQNISLHIKNALNEAELSENSVVKDYLTTALDGKISNAEMEKQVRNIYDKFNSKRKRIDAEFADAQDLEDLKELEKKINVI